MFLMLGVESDIFIFTSPILKLLYIYLSISSLVLLLGHDVSVRTQLLSVDNFYEIPYIRTAIMVNLPTYEQSSMIVHHLYKSTLAVGSCSLVTAPYCICIHR